MNRDIPLIMLASALAMYFIVAAFASCQPVREISGWDCRMSPTSSACEVEYK